MIQPLQSGGDVRDERDIEKINEIIGTVNALSNPISAQPHLIHVGLSNSGFVFDFSGLINAIEKTIAAKLKV